MTKEKALHTILKNLISIPIGMESGSGLLGSSIKQHFPTYMGSSWDNILADPVAFVEKNLKY